LLIGMAIWSPLIGKALDQLSARTVLIFGAASFSAGAAIIGNSHSLLLSIFAIFTLLAAGTAALGPLTASALTAKWFAPNSGKAVGLISVSSSMGGFLVVPIVAQLMEVYEWRTAMLIFACVIGIGFSTTAFLVVKEGDKIASTNSLNLAMSITTSQLLNSPPFWHLIAVIGTMMAISQAILSTMIPYALDLGIGATAAAKLISIVAISSVIGKLILGALLEKIDLHILQLIVVAAMAAFLCTLLAKPAYTTLLLACAIGGFSVGGTLPLWVAFSARIFGVRSVGSVMGLMTLVQLALVLGALWFVGYAFDANQNYDLAFTVFSISLAAPLLGLLGLKRFACSPVSPASYPDKSSP
jgi:MFS family permease